MRSVFRNALVNGYISYTRTIVSDQLHKYGLTASYGIEIGLVRPEMWLIFSSGRRLFSFDTKDINRC